MRVIKALNLSIRNFKGIKNFETNLTDVTNIFGANATGKTTLWDAYTFLFSGKDSRDRMDFGIKPYNPDGSEKHKLESEVSLDLMTNKGKVPLKRIYKETWTKKRGAEEAVFDGHTTNYEINLVPKDKKEYDAFINELCPENLFKLITSPSYFPAKLKWEAQRAILFEMAGEMSDQEIAEGNQKFIDLLDRASGKTFDDYKAMIGAKKRKIKESLDFIPARIDEVDRNLPQEQDWEAIQKEITKLTTETNKLASEIEDVSKLSDAAYQKRTALKNELYKHKEIIDTIKRTFSADQEKAFEEYNANKESIESEIRQLERKLATSVDEVKELEGDRARKEAQIENLRKEWTLRDAEKLEFKEGEFVCPTCERELEDIDEKRQELTEQFNVKKAEDLKAIEGKSKGLITAINVMTEAIAKMVEDIDSAKEKISAKKTLLSGLKEPQSIISSYEDNPEYKAAMDKIEEIGKELSLPTELPDTSELRTRKDELTKEVEALKTQLHNKEVLEKGIARIAELEQQQKELAQELASLEKEEFLMAEFTKEKINSIEGKVNSMFTLVKFKLFHIQVNGQEVPTCVATHNGVPYPDLNDAMKIAAGLDIIKTLSEYHKVKAPIWIDNRESTVWIPDMDTQVINLFVSAGDKVLRVE